MRFVNNSVKKTGSSEKGFVFIVALIAIVILIAIGFFALTIVSGDLMISYRLTGERKAYSAAESGAQSAYAILANYDMTLCSSCSISGCCTPSTQIDPDNDPSTRFSAGLPVLNGVMAPPHGGSPANYCSGRYDISVTGTDSNYDSIINVNTGVAGPAGPCDTIQR